MRKVRRGRRAVGLLVFVPLAILLGVASWLYARRDHPPVRDLCDARIYLNEIKGVGEEEEVAAILASAEQNLVDAQRALNAQYRRLLLFRDYDLVRYHTNRARALGAEATATAERLRQAAAAECAQRLEALRRSHRTTRDLVQRLTIRGQASARLVSAEVLLETAQEHLEAGENRVARQLLERAEGEIREASANLQSRLASFLERRREWNTWIRETLAASAQSNEPFVLIDKLNHECYVLRRGRVTQSFPVEFGNGWMERKIMEGDRATPEGRYQVSQIKDRGRSRYYKAALLDYPNATDRSRFQRAKRSGQIPRSARIGGLIEIHGDGGRGSNWTSGCISLTNGDMDRLMSTLRVGTPVTIVGVWQEPTWLSNGDLRNGS